jgi:Leucine-rich repeat (LRR) protein
MDRLELLDLSRNPLTALPESMAKLSRLKHLNLTGTKLKMLPAWLADLPSLETLSVDGPLPSALQRFARS